MLYPLDTLANVHPIKVCVAYRHKGRRLTEFPFSRQAQLEIEPVYESFAGFGGDLKGVRRFAGLPASARAYVLAVERRLGLPIPIVSVGPSREQTIVRDPRWRA